MTKEKLSFKSGSRICYSVRENNLNDFYTKIIDVATSKKNKDEEEDFIIELRLDYLLNKKVDIQDISDCISKARKYLLEEYEIEKQFIATIRGFYCGGNCLISDKVYLQVVEALYEKSKVDAIDIDYDFYERKTSAIKSLFEGKKTLIITYSCQDRVLTREEYDTIFKTLIKTPAYIIKIVTKAFSRDDTENLMQTAKDFETVLSENNKVVVVISTGKLGIVSRVWYEYSNTVIIYLNDYELDMEPAGEIDKRVFDKCRKLLSKRDKFSEDAGALFDESLILDGK